ncbi:hypothetical protein BCR33DRAFT_720285 [Rhizoclosmatium globosum]|uniref:UBX domain-containing protein n=1 Tax=Rhizoclosmatium globosum TaxID=329046 RepID=A0A1Y2BW84_9FUNG|nr:hypothetical protein BCR33DRAFT_720285 [Rhizoclosmatium globosum]|eukprot:ORY39020.1 hypothetical protein BCR33DRAFT_720285 [Rhizoclosmatium globosum]
MWLDETQLAAAIQQSVTQQQPLVVLVEDPSNSTVSINLATTFDATTSAALVRLRLVLGSPACAQFASVFPFPQTLRHPSLHLVAQGARKALLQSPATNAAVAEFVRVNLGAESVVIANNEETQDNNNNNDDDEVPPLSNASSFVVVEQDEVLNPNAVYPPRGLTQPQSSVSTTVGTPTTTTTISLKFSHDSVVVKSKFEYTDTLATIRTFIKKSGFIADFDFVLPYPFKVLVQEELSGVTLQDLCLVPTGSLVVKKKPVVVKKPVKKVEPKVEQAPKAPVVYDTASLSLRLPTGEIIRQKFQATDTLTTVHEFVATHIQQPFELSQLYPTRVFGVSEESLSLKALELVPSGTLAVKLVGGAVSAYNNANQGILAMLWVWILSVLGIVGGLFGGGTQRAEATPQKEVTQTENGGEPSVAVSKNDKFGSVAEMRRKEEQDKKGKTESAYNGNSTAQDF